MFELQSFTTEGVPVSERVDYWRAVTGSALIAQETRPLDPKGFCGRMTCLNLEDMCLADLDASPSTVRHVRPGIRSSAPPLFLFRLVMQGEIALEHAGRCALLRTGDIALCDTGLPYRISFGREARLLVVRIPRDTLLRYLPASDQLLGLRMSGEVGLSGLASRQIRGLWAGAREFLAVNAAARMGEISLQLLASAYCGVATAQPKGAVTSVTQRQCIVDFIERGLRDPDLSPPTIARELSITPGYLHRLFSVTGETVTRYILRRRLELCARALRDPLQAGRSITEIACENGFCSPPHFSRVFRHHYHVSPSSFRS